MLTKSLLALIRFYQRAVSPLTPAACRFTPTCSAYAEEVIEEYGPARGSWMALGRLLRCHPFGGSGYDPVPGRRELHDDTEAPRGASDATRTNH